MNPWKTLAALAIVAGASVLGGAILGCSSGNPDDPTGETESAVSSNNVHAHLTISYAPNSFVIGNAFPSWTDHLRGPGRRQPVGVGGNHCSTYQGGYFFGESFDHCGYVCDDDHQVSGGGNDDGIGSGCSDVGGQDALFRSTYTADIIGSDTPDSIGDSGHPCTFDASARGTHYVDCQDGNKTFDTSDCSDTGIYANVDPWLEESKPANKVGDISEIEGQRGGWRYVTKDKKWTLVIGPSLQGVNWYFVRSGCLQIDRQD